MNTRDAAPTTYEVQLVWEIPAIPNLSDPKYAGIGDSAQARHQAIIRHVTNFLQAFGQRSPSSAIAFRLVRSPDDPNFVSAYIVIRHTSEKALFPVEVEALRRSYEAMLPNRPYYRYVYLDPVAHDDSNIEASRAAGHQERRRSAMSVRDWAVYGLELCKEISFLPSARDTAPEELRDEIQEYWEVPARAISPRVNSLEELCASLLAQRGHAMVDITLCSSKPESGDIQAVVNRAQLLADHSGTQYIHNYTIPADRSAREALDVYEDLLKNLTQVSSWFLYAVRVFSSAEEPRGIIHTMSAQGNANSMSVVQLHEDRELLEKSVAAVESVRVVPDVNQGADQWQYLQSEINWFAQHLYKVHRMATVDELVGFWTLPVAFADVFPGFDIDRGQAQIPLRIGVDTERAINLGHTAEGRPVQIRLADLARHVLMVGTPGAGKTSTMFEVLSQLHTNHVPWLVLEPAKTEYRALRALFPDALVFTLGDERTVPFRFNPLELPDGTPVEKHISRLVTCFLGAFNLWDPLPMLLEKSIRRLYQESGWLMSDVGGVEDCPDPPTLTDLYATAAGVVEESGYYEGEILSNIRAGLLNRLESLQRGSIGRMLNVRRGLGLRRLLNQPVILELEALNPDERALMMMFLFTHVYEYAKSSRDANTGLQHVLVLEEAHNLIGHNTSASVDRANPRLHSIELFTNMLAEMRSLGEGIIIVDQLPSALAPQAMKNTSTKIVHQVVAADDREAISLTMGLRPNDPRSLDPVTFQPGEAFVFSPASKGGITNRFQVHLQTVVEQLKAAPPPSDTALRHGTVSLPPMLEFIEQHQEVFLPYDECKLYCRACNPRAREWSELHLTDTIRLGLELIDPDKSRGPIYGAGGQSDRDGDSYYADLSDSDLGNTGMSSLGDAFVRAAEIESSRVRSTDVPLYQFCTYVHFLNTATASRCRIDPEVISRLAARSEE